MRPGVPQGGTAGCACRLAGNVADHDATVTQIDSLLKPGTDVPSGWRIREGWEDLVVGADAPDWFALEDEPRAALVKRGHDRSVWRVTCGERTVYAKVGRMNGWVGRMKARLVGHAAQREWRASLKAEQRGVAVPQALGVAVRSGRGVQTVFLSLGVPGFVPLLDGWRERVSNGAGRCDGDAIIKAVAALLSDAHTRGFLHGDGHPDNILLSRDNGHGIRAVFVDVQGARFSPGPVSLGHRLQALAELDQSFHRHATRTERLRFLRQYFGLDSGLDATEDGFSDLRSFVEAFPRVSSVHAARLARQRDRRVWRKGKYFETIKVSGGWSVTVVLAVERRHLFSESNVPDRSPDDWRRMLAVIVDGIDAGQCVEDDAARLGLIVKVQRLRGLVSRLVSTLERSDHRKQFEGSHRARHRDEACALMLAFGVQRRLGLVHTTFLIRADHVQDDSTLGTPCSRNEVDG